MLSELQSPYRSLRIRPVKITTTATPSATVDQGGGSGDVIVRSGAGNGVLTLANPVDKTCLSQILTPGAASDAGGRCCTNGVPAPGIMNSKFFDHTGAAAEATLFEMLINTNDTFTTPITGGPLIGEPVTCAEGKDVVLYAIAVTAAGVATIGAPLVTVAKASSIYTLGFRTTFARAPFIYAMPVHASAAKALRVDSFNANGTAIATFQGGGTVEDNIFVAIILGFKNLSLAARQRTPIFVPRRRPRLIPIRYDTATGLIAGAGAEIFDFTNGGTGIKTFNYKAAYKPAAPGIVVVNPVGTTNYTNLSALPTTTGFTILSYDSSFNPVNSNLSGVVIDFGDVTEFHRM